MGFDEKLFKLGFRFFQRLKASPQSPFYEQRVELKNIESRLQLLAKSLCGHPIQVHQAENWGGFSGDHFYYPKEIFLSDNRRMNEWFYIHRTIFYCSARELGFCLPQRDLSDFDKKIFTCLAVHSVWQHISFEYSGAADFLQELVALANNDLSKWSKEDLETQNGILAQWIRDLLIQNWTDSRWKEILTRRYSSKQEYWEFAEDILKTQFEGRRPGPPLPEEAMLLWGVFMPVESSLQDLRISDQIENSEVLASGTEIEAPARENIVKVNLDEKKNEANPVMHSFEKIETLDEYKGGFRTQDGDDQIKEHAEALADLKIREVIRSREKTSSVYKAEIRLESLAPDIESSYLEESRSIQFFKYPEWDYRSRQYRPDWCQVLEETKPSAKQEFALNESYRPQKKELKKLFDSFKSRQFFKKRQPDGSEIDIDTLVTRQADLKAGEESGNHLYLRLKRERKDWQCLLLIDNSLSTDSWTDNERVLEVIKNSIAVLADVLEDEVDSIGVASFHSNTRHNCTFRKLKGFSDSWSHLKKQLSKLEPEGYTRIGPAIRHSLKILDQSQARHKIVIILTDGKATDFDHYEGRYGMEDIKAALREVRDCGIHVKCLAIEKKAKYYLPQVFGAAHVQILPRVHSLPQGLAKLILPILKA